MDANNTNKNEKVYTEADLVSFGNYLLSGKRLETIDDPNLVGTVGDWDLANWKETQKSE